MVTPDDAFCGVSCTLIFNYDMWIRGLQMAKNVPKIANVSILAIFRPLTGNKTSSNYFFLVEEVLSFNSVGHM